MCDNLQSSLKKEVMFSARNGVDASILHLFAICNVRNSSIFNKLLKPHTQLEQPHSCIPTKEGSFFTWFFQHKRQLMLHTFLISINNRSFIPMFTAFKLQGNWIFRSPPSKKNSLHTLQSVIISKKYLSFKFFGLLISSSTKAEEGTGSENVSKEQF